MNGSNFSYCVSNSDAVFSQLSEEKNSFTSLDEARNYIFSNEQYLISDLNGTIIGAPGKNEQPQLKDSPTYKPLIDWLSRHGKIIAITGNDAARMTQRFLNDIPEKLRQNNQVLLAANGGASLYYLDKSGAIVEEDQYRKTAIPGGTTFLKSQESLLCELALDYINRFYNKLYFDLALILDLPEKYHFLAEIAVNRKGKPFMAEELLSFNTDITPRIEMRKIHNEDYVVQIAIVGVPAEINFPLDTDIQRSIASLGPHPGIIKMGFSTQIMVEGVDKVLPILWLDKNKRYDLDASKCIAIGDSPEHNDRSLVEFMSSNIPFISVSEKKTHSRKNRIYEIGGRCFGTAKLIEGLVNEGDILVQKGVRQLVLLTKVASVIESIIKTV